MQYSVSFSGSVTVAILFFTIYPVSSTYFQALKSADLPSKDFLILGFTPSIAGFAGVYFGATLLTQIDVVCILDFLTFIAAFVVQNWIFKKGPAFFTKHFFQKKGGSKKVAS